MTAQLSIRPIGGVAQIGSNMTQISYGKTNFIIDCGILFPYEDAFDINYLIPDLEHLKNETTPEAIIFTHGHEDHIGAVAHFIDTFPKAKMYAPPFAAALIKQKLSQLGRKCSIEMLYPKQSLMFDELKITPIHVNHSIPDTLGILLEAPALDTALFFCSDFKVDEKKYLEPAFDLQDLKNRMGHYKRRVVLADSTNILSDQLKTHSEESLYADLHKLIKNAPERTFITSFASNIHRMQTIFSIAKDLKKRVVLYGNAMKKYASIAQETGHLDTFGLDRDVDQVDPKSPELIILVSGCQGDFRSAFRRVATGEDSFFKLKQNDTFLFSSKSIPGNEKKIGLLKNLLVEAGVDIHQSGKYLIHASGHAGQHDLEMLYRAINPTHAYPIHGESIFLKAHRDFIQENFPETSCGEIYNYDVITISQNDVSVSKGKPIDPILIHGNLVPIERTNISQRRKMAQNGIIILSIVRKNKSLQIKSLSQGVPESLVPDDKVIESTVRSCLGTKVPSEEIRIRIRRLLSESLGYKPITHVFFHSN